MHYDAIIIGTGQAGFPLAGALTEKGWRVALAEGGNFGGTCINTGCTPTKALVASARAAHVARTAANLGVITGPVEVNFDRVMARTHQLVEHSRSEIVDWLTGIDNLDIYREYATFEGPHSVRVGNQVIEGERIYINTGARAVVPSLPGLDAIDYLTDANILELRALPDHLVIIGGGYVGLEFAQVFRRFGSAVTLIERAGQIMRREDPDIASAAHEILAGEGIEIRLNTSATRVYQTGDQVTVIAEDAGGAPREITGSRLLVAVGRRPNSDRLNLENAGVESDERGYITVNDYLQTNVPHIWALGDVNGRGAFTHTSYNDFEIIRDNLDGADRKVSDRILTYGVFIDPPLGRVGMSEQDVRTAGREALIACKPMSHVSRAIKRGETQGLMKVLVDAKTHKFLGAMVLGIGGDEVIHAITNLMYADAPYTVMKNAVHIHPTVTELLPTTLAELEPLEKTESAAATPA